MTNTRLKPRTIVSVVVGTLVVLVLVGVLVVRVQTPAVARGCELRVCPGPPPREPLRLGEVWRSALGAEVEYSSRKWTLTHSDGETLDLHAGKLSMWIKVAPASVSPSDLVDQELGRLRGSIPTLSADCVVIPERASHCSSKTTHRVYGPHIGFRDGIGGMWAGTTADGAGQLSVRMMTATDGRVTALAGVATATPFGGWGSRWQSEMLAVDSVVNSFLYPRAAL